MYVLGLSLSLSAICVTCIILYMELDRNYCMLYIVIYVIRK